MTFAETSRRWAAAKFNIPSDDIVKVTVELEIPRGCDCCGEDPEIAVYVSLRSSRVPSVHYVSPFELGSMVREIVEA